MLDSHPDLAIPHETRFLVYAFRRRARWGDLSVRSHREELARWVVGRDLSRHRRLSDEPEEIVEAIVTAAPTIGSVLSAGFRVHAARQGKVRWGDKRPALILDLDALFSMFPDGQYINVVRDPRAAVASIRRVGEAHDWGSAEAHARGCDRIVRGTELWDRSQRAARRWQRRLGRDRFLEIQYERLVADPRATLEQVVDFLDLDPAGLDDMLGFHKRTSNIYSEKMHPLIVNPVVTGSLRRWEQELSAPEIAFIEEALAAPMQRYGYEPLNPAAAAPQDMRVRLRTRRREMRVKTFRKWRMERIVRLRYRRPLAAMPDPGPLPQPLERGGQRRPGAPEPAAAHPER